MNIIRIIAHILPFIALCTVWLWMGSSLRYYSISDERNAPQITEHDISGFSWAHGDIRVFNWHPLLMVFGLVFCSSQAALTYGSLPFTHFHNKQLHLILHGVGLLSALLGLIAVFRYHNDRNITNLYSLHSWFGIILITGMLLIYIGTFVTFYYPGASIPLRKEIAPYHVVLGIATLALILVTAGAGITEKLMFNNSCNLTGMRKNGEVVKGYKGMDCRWGIGLGLILLFNFLFLILALLVRHLQTSNKSSHPVSLYSNTTDERVSLLGPDNQEQKHPDLRR